MAFPKLDKKINSYHLLGIAFCLASVIFIPISYFIIASIPLTAVGISVLTIGITCIALANTRPYISPEACDIILKTGMENTAALIEELGLKNKAIYLPSTMRDGHPQALIPLTEEEEIKKVKGKIPGRLIVRYGSKSEEMAIAVTTPGSINVEMLERKPAPNADEIKAAISYILSGLLDLADSVKVTISDSQVNVEITGTRLHYEDIWYYRCLGSPIASIAAAITSEAFDKPTSVINESYKNGKSRIEIKVIS